MHGLSQTTRFTTVAFFFCFALSLSAQTITANVTGTVTDSTGAIIRAARVTATNIETNVSTTTTSNNDGYYSIRFLQIGRYNVVVVAPGFPPRTFGPVTLEANQSAKIDAAMSIAGDLQVVAVQAEVAPLLNTENAQLGVTLDEQAIHNIPLVGEQFIQLTMFAPGAINTQPAALAGNGSIGVNQAQNNGVSVNGNRQQANNYLLDGIEINETLNNTVGYNPSPEALGQIQMTSANANAEYGNVNGGDVIMLLKSGTNKFHGSAYYFISDYIFDANTWANKHFASSSSFLPKASYTQPIFGGTIGGPLMHDRLFFFADYDGGRFHTGSIGTASVPTLRMRQGDFSELLDAGIMGGKTIQLYDASTTAFTPYANNQIPILNPVAKYLFAHPEALPLPNHAPTGNTPDLGNYTAPSKARMYNNQFDVKVDYKISEKDSLMGRWIQSDNGSTTTPVIPISFPANPISPVKGFALNEIHTFSASLVNEFRAGYHRIRPEAGFPSDTTGDFGTNGNAKVGIPGGNQGIVGFAAQTPTPGSTSGLNVVNGSEYSTLGNSYGGMTFVDNNFTYGDNLTWLKGRHTFKFGVQFLREQSNAFSAGNDGVLGTMAYTGVSTLNGATGKGGYSMADFVLDRVDYIGQGAFTGPQGLRSWRDAYFAQDDWRVTPTLTLNLGARYEFDQPMYEVNNKYANVNLATHQLVHAGDSGAAALGGRALVFPYYGGFMPRIGFSLAVTPRFVLRGGYGAQNFMEATGEARRMTLNPPNNSDNFSTGSAPTATSAATYFAAESGFTNPSSPGAILALNAWDSHIRPAYIGEYSLTTEYAIGETISLRVGYVGENGQHLINHNAANQLYSPCIINGIVQSPYNSPACIASGQLTPFAALVGESPTLGSGSVTLTTSNAMMNYNALQVSLRQRAWRGLQYTVNYTYSRAMTNSIGFFGAPQVSGANNYAENGYNNHAEYGPTGQDARNSVNGNVVYDLPLGRGRSFGTNMNRVLDEVVGGWRIGLTGVAYSGLPFTVNNSTNNAATNNKIQRANQYRNIRIVNRNVSHWFGTDPSVTDVCAAGVDDGICAFGSPALGTYGTASVGSLRTPGYRDFDASVSKAFPTYREQKVEFRVDASNVLNITSLGNPATQSIQSASFGTITSVRSGPRKLQLDLKYLF
jgi:hypothetical protein